MITLPTRGAALRGTVCPFVVTSAPFTETGPGPLVSANTTTAAPLTEGPTWKGWTGMKHVLTSASVLALSATPLLAQDESPYQLPTLTLYANSTPFELGRTGTSVSVLTGRDLDESPETTLADTLDTLPGVNVVSNGGPGTRSAVSIRGLPAYYAPVYINGIEVTDSSATQTSFNFGTILPGGVSRVEVLKGAQSALYGADAVAGIVAIDLARAPEEPGQSTKLAAEAGTYNTKSAALSYGAATERAGVAVSATRFVTDGFSAVEADGYDEDDGFAATQLAFDSYFQATPDLRVGLSGFRFDGEGDYDSNDFTAPESGTTDTESYGLRAYAQLQTGAVAHELAYSRYQIDRDTDAAGWSDSFGSTRDKWTYSGTWEFAAGRSLSFGADHSLEEADFSAPVYDAFFSRVGTAENSESIDTTGAYAELAWAFTPDVDAVVTVRHDDHSEFGGEWSGRATMSWRATEALTLRGALAKGYRAPSLYELYSPSYGNDGLEPETSRGGEIGADYAFANGATLGATWFYTEIDDLIQYEGTGYAQVSGTSVSKGLELAGSVPLGDRFTLSGSYTFTDARDENDDPLARVPRYDLAMRLDADITDELRAGLSVLHKADYAETFGVTGQDESDDHTVVNAQASYAFGNGLEGYVRIENLFDEDYQVVPDYQTTGRAYYAGIRARF